MRAPLASTGHPYKASCSNIAQHATAFNLTCHASLDEATRRQGQAGDTPPARLEVQSSRQRPSRSPTRCVCLVWALAHPWLSAWACAFARSRPFQLAHLGASARR